MMSGRSGSRPTMSLLAFQDIITSVSGILMFIVLMLSLELSNEAASDSPRVDPADLEQLESSVAAARERKSSLERTLGGGDDLARAAAAVAPAQLRSDILTLDQQISDIEQTIDALKSRRDTLLADRRASQNEQEADASQRESEIALEEAARLAQEISELKSDDRPVFSLPKGFNKDGWLVVISPGRCDVAPLGRRASPREFPVASGGLFDAEPDVSAFLDWANSQGPNAYFLLIVRPGAAAAFEAVKLEFESRNVAFGFDLAGTRRKLLDQKRGAFQ